MQASVFVGISVDGFMARPEGGLDFLPEGGGEPHGYDEFMASVDALVIGRGTFETVLGFGSWPYGKKRVVVLSSRPLDLSAAQGGVVEQMAGTPAEILARLEASGARHLYIDGGLTIQGFLKAGLISRLILTRVPVLIGQGIPLFGTLPQDIRLRHLRTRSFESGLVQSEYEMLGGAETDAAVADAPEAQVRQLLERWARATRENRLDDILTGHAPQALIYDVLPPLQYEGTEAYRRSWGDWQPATQGEDLFQLEDLVITAGAEVAFAHGLLRCGGRLPDGRAFEERVRATFGLRKAGGRWQVMHQHISKPSAPN